MSEIVPDCIAAARKEQKETLIIDASNLNGNKTTNTRNFSI